MSTGHPSDDASALPTHHCPACGADVGSGPFCPTCGSELSADPGPIRLRLRAFAAAPRERVLRPWLSSSLFPQLPGRSRTPFRIGLAALLLLLAGVALLRWQAPLIAIAAFGFPLLFATYLREIGARQSVSIRLLVLTAVIGAALGISWAYFTDTVFADGYDVALGFEVAAGPNVAHAVVISIVEALLMFVPAVIVRMLTRPPRESLDGYLVGSLGATAFTAAATVTFLAPQLAAGLVADGRSLEGILVEAAIQGAAMPLASAAVGGTFGVALWFTGHDPARRVRGNALALIVVSAVVLFTGFGLLDVSPFSNSWYVAGYLLIAVLALFGLRIALQAALLHEAPGSSDLGEQFRCAGCDHIYPSTPFCPNCGLATRASSRASRRARRVTDGLGEAVERPTRVLAITGVGVACAAAAATVVSLLITPGVAPYRCPPDCGSPPIGQPVETNPRFTADDGAFTVDYPGEHSAYQPRFDPDGVVLRYLGGDTGTLALFGTPADNRTPQDIALEVIREKYPNATISYEIPNASVGYQPGYGVVADEFPRNSTANYAHIRLLVLVAVKNDYALVAAAAGPYHQFSPDYGSGHPSGANLELAMDMGKYVNSFRWRGDREVGGS